MRQIVDTHAHIYHSDEKRYPLRSDPLRPPRNTGDIGHLRREMQAAGVARAVLVQTGSAYRWDNRLLADTSLANQDWAVGVCTLDPAAIESIAELERLVAGSNVRGLRVEPTKAPQPMFDHPGADRMWRAAKRLGIVICAHIRGQFTAQLAALLSRYPDVPVVLDHAAYPRAAEGTDSKTVTSVVELARFPNLYLKLTFAVTGSQQDFPFRDMHPILYHLLEAYSPDRCMWGSDFPCELWLKKATYRSHLSLFTEALELSERDRTAILQDTPMRVWFPDSKALTWTTEARRLRPSEGLDTLPAKLPGLIEELNQKALEWRQIAEHRLKTGISVLAQYEQGTIDGSDSHRRKCAKYGLRPSVQQEYVSA